MASVPRRKRPSPLPAPIPAGGGREGEPIDYTGNSAFDPTQNVKDLSEASAQRQDDLRNAAKELSDAKLSHLKEIGDLRARFHERMAEKYEGHQEKQRAAESNRLDSIRQVDREEVAKTAAAANTAITTLAKQTTDLATTLQQQVTNTAAAAESRTSAAYNETNKRISALELSSSEGKGRGAVVDPQMEKLTALVETLARSRDQGAGKSEGVSTAVAMMFTVGGIVISLIAAFGVTLAFRGGP